METDSIKKNLPQKRIFNLSDRIQKGMINFFGNKLDYQYMSITSPILEMKNEIDIDRLKECKKGFNREKLDDKQSGRKFIGETYDRVHKNADFEKSAAVQDFITFIHKREQKLEKLNAAASFANTPKELQRTAKITTDREISKNLETTFTTILKSLKTLDGLFADPRMKAFLDDKMHENDDPKGDFFKFVKDDIFVGIEKLKTSIDTFLTLCEQTGSQNYRDYLHTEMSSDTPLEENIASASPRGTLIETLKSALQTAMGLFDNSIIVDKDVLPEYMHIMPGLLDIKNIIDENEIKTDGAIDAEAMDRGDLKELIRETTEWSDLMRPEMKLFKDAMKNKMETKSNQAQYKLLELYANRILQSIESCQNAFEEKSVKEYLDGEQAKASTNFGILGITSEFLQLEKRVNDLLALFKETGGNSYAAYLKSKEKKIISGISERYTERE